MRRDLTLPLAPAPLPSGVTLAPFDERTARLCRDLMNRVYAESLGDDPVPFDAWWPRLIADSEYDQDGMFVARAGSDVIGFCHCWRVPFIKDLVIDCGHRRKGLGAGLLTLAMAACANRGALSIDLKTDIGNLTAQSLYRHLGFAIVERIG